MGETTTGHAARLRRLNARDLRRVVAFLVGCLPAGQTLFPQTGGCHWVNLCDACGLSSEEMVAAINEAAREGNWSIRRELRAQRGGAG